MARCALWALALALPVAGRAQASGIPEGKWRVVAAPNAGYHLLGPVRISLTAALGIGNAPLSEPGANSAYVLAFAEPGWRAGRLSLGYAHWYRLKGALIWRATMLQFWDGAPHRRYAGGELQWVISVLPLGVRIGAYKPTDSDRGPRRLLWLADMSVMY